MLDVKSRTTSKGKDFVIDYYDAFAGLSLAPVIRAMMEAPVYLVSSFFFL